ncbi:lipoprotein lipase-like [Cochliomyia hominivorax]
MKTLAFFFLAVLALCSASPLRESSQDLLTKHSSGNVKFYLYTKDNPTEPQELVINNVDSVKKSHFNKSLQTKIIIHGWTGSYKSTPNGPIREAYLSQGFYNIISVDWSEYAKLNYVMARNKVPLVGEEVAEFVDFLNEKFQMTFDSLVVIGHSLGAHVAGFCGKSIKRGTLSYIVGLDPASPLYSYDKPATRLANTDAKYVETIQTNGKTKGFLKPIGTASFYANWGRVQPGCGKDLDGKCSHARCVSLYAEAIKGHSFAPIYKCKNYENILNKSGCTEVAKGVKIGDPTNIEHETGIFNFNTKSEAPYGHK